MADRFPSAARRCRRRRRHPQRHLRSRRTSPGQDGSVTLVLAGVTPPRRRTSPGPGRTVTLVLVDVTLPPADVTLPPPDVTPNITFPDPGIAGLVLRDCSAMPAGTITAAPTASARTTTSCPERPLVALCSQLARALPLSRPDSPRRRVRALRCPKHAGRAPRSSEPQNPFTGTATHHLWPGTTWPFAYVSASGVADAGDDPVNGSDPTGLYDYFATEQIGPVSAGSSSVGSAQFVMAAMKKYVLHVFPFPITHCGSSLANGAECELHATNIYGTPSIAAPDCIFQGCGWVRVGDWTPTTFNFTVNRNGYFDAPGAVITFSTFERGNTVYLQQHGYAPGTNGPKGWIDEDIAEDFVWRKQANNLTNLMHEVLAEIPGYTEQCHSGNYSNGNPGEIVGPPAIGYPTTPPSNYPT